MLHYAKNYAKKSSFYQFLSKNFPSLHKNHLILSSKFPYHTIDRFYLVKFNNKKYFARQATHSSSAESCWCDFHSPCHVIDWRSCWSYYQHCHLHFAMMSHRPARESKAKREWNFRAIASFTASLIVIVKSEWECCHLHVIHIFTR